MTLESIKQSGRKRRFQEFDVGDAFVISDSDGVGLFSDFGKLNGKSFVRNFDSLHDEFCLFSTVILVFLQAESKYENDNEGKIFKAEFKSHQEMNFCDN